MKKSTLALISTLPLSASGQTSTWLIELRAHTWPILEAPRFENRTHLGRIDLHQPLPTADQTSQLFYHSESPLFSLTQDFDGSTYTAENDLATGYPILTFTSQNLTGINFRTFFSGPAYPEGAFLQLHPNRQFSYSPDGVQEYEGTYLISPSPVPEPSTAILLLLSSLSLTYRHRP